MFNNSNRIRFDEYFISLKTVTVDNLLHIVESINQKLSKLFEIFANISESKNFQHSQKTFDIDFKFNVILIFLLKFFFINFD